MKALILSLLTAWCSHAYCDTYADTLSSAVTEAAQAHDLDPRLLLAVAWQESRFRPWARSKVAGGPFQLHVASLWGRRAAWECTRPDVTFRECMWIQANEAAYVLRTEIDRCGSVRGGLAAYNTGRCDHAHGLKYAARVLRVRNRL